jgi:hypothetical protein
MGARARRAIQAVPGFNPRSRTTTAIEARLQKTGAMLAGRAHVRLNDYLSKWIEYVNTAVFERSR